MKNAELVYQHLLHLPESISAEVLDFVEFLERRQNRNVASNPRMPGTAKGQIWMATDFDAPLTEFAEYQ